MPEHAGSVVAYQVQVLVAIEIRKPGAPAANERHGEGRVIESLPGMASGQHAASSCVSSVAQRIRSGEAPLGIENGVWQFAQSDRVCAHAHPL